MGAAGRAPRRGPRAARGALTYDVGIEPDEHMHGLTLREMGGLYAEVLGALGIDRPEPEAPPPYTGGEIVAATGATLRRMDALFDGLWAEMLRRHAAGLPRFYEESHALSFLYYALDVLDGTANPFLRRIWTATADGLPPAGPGGQRRTAPTDLGLTLWHLPSEKRTGFRHLFAEAMTPGSAFWALAPRRRVPPPRRPLSERPEPLARRARARHGRRRGRRRGRSRRLGGAPRRLNQPAQTTRSNRASI